MAVQLDELDPHPIRVRPLHRLRGLVAEPRGFLGLALDQPRLGQAELVQRRAAQALRVAQLDRTPDTGSRLPSVFTPVMSDFQQPTTGHTGEFSLIEIRNPVRVTGRNRIA